LTLAGLLFVTRGPVELRRDELLQLGEHLVELLVELRIRWPRTVVLLQHRQDDPAPPPPPDVVLAEGDVTTGLRALAEVWRVARIVDGVGVAERLLRLEHTVHVGVGVEGQARRRVMSDLSRNPVACEAVPVTVAGPHELCVEIAADATLVLAACWRR
jgi:hypothetical protein